MENYACLQMYASNLKYDESKKFNFTLVLVSAAETLENRKPYAQQESAHIYYIFVM